MYNKTDKKEVASFGIVLRLEDSKGFWHTETLGEYDIPKKLTDKITKFLKDYVKNNEN